MRADHVVCCWCEVESFIPIGEKKCPNCDKEGYLMWADGDNPEVEVEHYGYVIEKN